jgi:OOP family OmpA-OmpF porin
MRFRVPVALVVAVLTCAACHEPEPTSPTVGLTLPVDPPQPPDLGNYLDRETTVHIVLGDTLRQYCVGPAPFFHFESDKVIQPDQPALYALVGCMKDGPLQGKRIQLTGRTDPRGTAGFNEKLGQERAVWVKKFLVDQGIASDRVVTASAGKTEAAPQPSKWRTDRRVDIDVIP